MSRAIAIEAFDDVNDTEVDTRAHRKAMAMPLKPPRLARGSRPHFERKATDVYPDSVSVSSIFEMSEEETELLRRAGDAGDSADADDAAVTRQMQRDDMNLVQGTADTIRATPASSGNSRPLAKSPASANPPGKALPGMPPPVPPWAARGRGAAPVNAKVERQLGVVALAAFAADPFSADLPEVEPVAVQAAAPAPAAAQAPAWNEHGGIETIASLPATRSAKRRSTFTRGLVRLGSATLLGTIIAIGLIVAAAFGYTATGFPVVALSGAGAAGLIALAAGALLLRLFGFRHWFSAGVGMLGVTALALATTWVVRLGFPLGLAESITAMAPVQLLSGLEAMTQTALASAGTLFQSYWLALWAVELAVFGAVAVWGFRFVTRRG